jgi:lipopolysaccharide export system ATP-binding protein
VDVAAVALYRRRPVGAELYSSEASIFRGLIVEDNIRAILEVIEPIATARVHAGELLVEIRQVISRAPAIALSGGPNVAALKFARVGFASSFFFA